MFNKTFVFLFIFFGILSCNTLRTSQTVDSTPKGIVQNNQIGNKRAGIAQLAKKQIGIKYKYAGKSPKTGFDCSGFTHFVLKNHDISVSGSSAEQAKQGTKTSLKNSKPGDLVFFKRGGKGRVFHVAMIYENQGGKPKVIHSTSSRGVVIDDLLSSGYWSPKIWQVRNVID